jgi:hypothetical protein
VRVVASRFKKVASRNKGIISYSRRPVEALDYMISYFLLPSDNILSLSMPTFCRDDGLRMSRQNTKAMQSTVVDAKLRQSDSQKKTGRWS